MATKLNLGTDRQQEFFDVWRSTHVKDPELAKYLGVDRSLVGHWRTGKREMPAEAFIAALEHLSDNDEAAPETVCRHLVELTGRRATFEPPPASGDLAKEVSDVHDAFSAFLHHHLLDMSDGRIDDPARKVELLDALIAQAREAREAALVAAGMPSAAAGSRR